MQHARPSAESFFAMRSDTIEALVTKSVEGNTFRAFHLRARGHGPGPASLYEATRDVALNNREKCNLVQVDDVRRVVQSLRLEADDQARATEVIDVPIETRIGGWASPVPSSSRRARP